MGIIFQGSLIDPTSCIVSVSEATELLSEGSKAFGASLVESESEPKDLSTIPVVAEFSNVFPEELPGLPPRREVEFEIDLVSGTEPISKAPYKMAPAELKELKAQLEELLQAGFIQPNTSPWGALVLPSLVPSGCDRVRVGRIWRVRDVGTSGLSPGRRRTAP